MFLLDYHNYVVIWIERMYHLDQRIQHLFVSIIFDMFSFHIYNGSIHQKYIAHELHKYLYKTNHKFNSMDIQIKCKICNKFMVKEVSQSILICGHRFCYSCLGNIESFGIINKNYNLPKCYKRCPICDELYHNKKHKWDYQYNNNNLFTTLACHKYVFVQVIQIKYLINN